MSKHAVGPSSTLRRMLAETLGERARELTRLGTQLTRYDFEALPRTRRVELLSQAMRALVLDQELTVSWEVEEDEQFPCRSCRERRARGESFSVCCSCNNRSWSGTKAESRSRVSCETESRSTVISHTVGHCEVEGYSLPTNIAAEQEE